MAQITRLLFAFVGVLAAAGPAAPQADPPPQPAAILDNGETMDILVKPAYIELQEAMATPPADRKAWATIYQKAVRLAEMEYLLFRDS